MNACSTNAKFSNLAELFAFIFPLISSPSAYMILKLLGAMIISR